MYLYVLTLLLVANCLFACPMRAQCGNFYGGPNYADGAVPQGRGVPGRLVAIPQRRQRPPPNVYRQRRPRRDDQAHVSQALLRQVRSEHRSRIEMQNREEPVEQPTSGTGKTRQTIMKKGANILDTSKDMIHQGIGRLTQSSSDARSNQDHVSKGRVDEEDKKAHLRANYDERLRQLEKEKQTREQMIRRVPAQSTAQANVIPRIPITSTPVGGHPVKSIQLTVPPQIHDQQFIGAPAPAPTQYIVIPQQQVVPEKQTTTTRTIVVEEYILPGPTWTNAMTGPQSLPSTYQINSSV